MEVEAGVFVEATVVGVDGERASVQTALDGENFEVGSGDLLSVTSGIAGPESGVFAVCGVGASRWVGCRLREGGGSVRWVSLEDGSRRELPSAQVLAAGALTRLNIERRFSRVSARSEFRRNVRAAGSPFRPPGWRPGPGEQILARRGDGWFSGRVHELDEGTVYVRFPGEARAVPLAGTDTRPTPPLAHPSLEPGIYVLARPTGEARAWEAMAVAAVGEDETVVVVDERGEKSQRRLRDLTPLGPEPTGAGTPAAE